MNLYSPEYRREGEKGEPCLSLKPLSKFIRLDLLQDVFYMSPLKILLSMNLKINLAERAIRKSI